MSVKKWRRWGTFDQKNYTGYLRYNSVGYQQRVGCRRVKEIDRVNSKTNKVRGPFWMKGTNPEVFYIGLKGNYGTERGKIIKLINKSPIVDIYNITRM